MIYQTVPFRRDSLFSGDPGKKEEETMVHKKEELFSTRCDKCGKSRVSIKLQEGPNKGHYLCINCFVEQTSQAQEPSVVYISVSGGVVSVDKKTKGVKVIIREHDEEKERGWKKPFLITYSEDKEIECNYDFFAKD